MVAAVTMNLYTDARVPVTLPPFVDINDYDGETVTAAGAWTRQGVLPGSEMGLSVTGIYNCLHSFGTSLS
jgi:hypothetical protein